MKIIGVIGVALLSLLLTPASAGAFYFTVVERPDGRWAYQEDEWIRQASIPPPDVDVIVARERCPRTSPASFATHSCAALRGWKYRIWLDPDTDPRWMRWMFHHELFHVRDRSEGPRLNRVRRALRRINGWGGPWWKRYWPSSFDGVLAGPSERAADAAAWCAITPRREWRSFDPAVELARRPGYLWQPTRREFVKTCRWLRRR